MTRSPSMSVSPKFKEGDVVIHIHAPWIGTVEKIFPNEADPNQSVAQVRWTHSNHPTGTVNMGSQTYFYALRNATDTTGERVSIKAAPAVGTIVQRYADGRMMVAIEVGPSDLGPPH